MTHKPVKSTAEGAFGENEFCMGRLLLVSCLRNRSCCGLVGRYCQGRPEATVAPEQNASQFS
jgi:hypothetical protein